MRKSEALQILADDHKDSDHIEASVHSKKPKNFFRDKVSIKEKFKIFK